MATHNFSFVGGEQLAKIGASWFVSYAYYEKIDRTHKNWNNIGTASVRVSKYNKSRAFHKKWLLEVINMNPNNLNKNTIDLSAEVIKDMAKELLYHWK